MAAGGLVHGCTHQLVLLLLLLLFLQDKQAESLRERLVVRLQLGGPREWRLVAWCIAQLGYSEKGLKRVMEMTACYRHTLGEQQVCLFSLRGLGFAARLPSHCRTIRRLPGQAWQSVSTIGNGNLALARGGWCTRCSQQ